MGNRGTETGVPCHTPVSHDYATILSNGMRFHIFHTWTSCLVGNLICSLPGSSVDVINPALK